MKKEKAEVGKVYFVCSWLTLKYPVPQIETWVYEGAKIDTDGSIYHQFVDPEWYFLDETISELTEDQRESYDRPEEPKLLTVDDSELEDLFYDLDELKKYVNTLDGVPKASNVFTSK